ncbi:MAG: tetratricopeptide repeat protein [Pyrinomonadaceae bacterium]
MMKKFVLFVLVFSCVTLALGQPQQGSAITPEMRAAANDAFQKQDWKAAVAAYEKIVKAEEKNAGARYRYGMSLLGAGSNVEAQKQLETVFASSPNPVFGLALSRAYVRNSNKDKAYETLEKSITIGGISPDSLSSEADFAAIKTEAKFIDLVKKHDVAVNPCKASPSFREFDFWIGEWDAKNTQGVTVGSSSIQLILGQCIIFENWSTPVSSGKSFNIFNTTDKKWHQTWVDDKGTFTHYIGGIVDGKMVLDSDTMFNGKKAIGRMTFSKLPNGDVRQHGERSIDEGKTWTTTFDFAYVRKK